eukprot:g51839.t1
MFVSLLILSASSALAACAAPSEFSAAFIMIDEYQTFMSKGYFVYDAKNYRVARTFQAEVAGKETDVWQQVNMWNSGKFGVAEMIQYDIDLTQKTCTTSRVEGARFRPFGVPPSSNMTNQYNMGGPNEFIRTSMWSERYTYAQDETGQYYTKDTNDFQIDEAVRYNDAGAPYKFVTEVISRDKCWPISFTQAVPKQDGRMDIQNTQWFNVVQGIANPNLFSVPSYCKSSNVKTVQSQREAKLVYKAPLSLKMEKPSQTGFPKILF